MKEEEKFINPLPTFSNFRTREEIMKELEEEGNDFSFIKEEILLDIRDVLIKIERKL